MKRRTIEAADGLDEARKVDKRDWRVRVRRLEEKAPSAPLNSDAPLAPAVVSVVVSVALLGRDGEVATDDAGRLLVFDATTVTFQAESLGQQGLDPGKAIEDAIQERIAQAAAELDGRRKLEAELARWASHPSGPDAITLETAASSGSPEFRSGSAVDPLTLEKSDD